MVEKPRSIGTEGVYAALHAELLKGGVMPGSKLNTVSIAARYDVSLSVVREALIRLVADGLVRALPQRGFCVAPLSPEDLLDLTQSRVLVETVTLRRAIAMGDLAWESGVLAAYHALEKRHTGDLTASSTTHGLRLMTHSTAHCLQEPRVPGLSRLLRRCGIFHAFTVTGWFPTSK